MKPLSYITETFTESVIREMTRISDSMGGLNLSQGFPDFNTPEIIKKAAITAIINNKNQYPVTFGEPVLRQAISDKVAKFNKIKVNPETEITVTCGATEAMLATLMAIINPGDEVIIFQPFYENYGPDAILSNAIPKYVNLMPPDWGIDYDELSAAFNNKTKAIIINTPNNPTGKVFSNQDLQYIANLCLKWDVYAITDEIYEHIVYDGLKHISLASIDGMAERTVTINSISKTYSVTGWRVGWAIANSKITEKIRKVHDFFTVGAPSPFQYAAAFILNFEDDYYKKLAADYELSRNHIIETLSNSVFVPYIPHGAYYVIARVDELFDRIKAKDDFDFSRKLLQKTKVATVPGFSFYSEKKLITKTVRFAFCKKMETLEQLRKLLSEL